MKTKEISSTVIVDIDPNSQFPIIIESAGNYINITLDELERVYIFAKKTLI